MSQIRKPRKNCKNCGKPCSRPEKIYCSIKCQAELKYKEFIIEWLDNKVSGMQPNGLNISRNVRRWLMETRGNRCEHCGWNEINPITGKIPLEVNHIDGNSENSAVQNLELICPNCHSLTPNFRNLNKGSGRKKR